MSLISITQIKNNNKTIKGELNRQARNTSVTYRFCFGNTEVG
jgi:hypothetical protein